MQTIGKLLKKRREQLGYSLQAIQAELRIRQKYLQALEADDFTNLPSVNYIKGFIRNYSRYLGLDEEKVLAFFRRQYGFTAEQKLMPAGFARPLDEPLFKITPQRAAILVALMLLVGFVIYLFSQLHRPLL